MSRIWGCTICVTANGQHLPGHRAHLPGILCLYPTPCPSRCHLGAPQVKKLVQVVEAGSDDRNLLAGFKGQLGELTKLAAEARDNVKFLTTLERHFKNITSGPLNGILDTLPPMMNALRMVRHAAGGEGGRGNSVSGAHVKAGGAHGCRREQTGAGLGELGRKGRQGTANGGREKQTEAGRGEACGDTGEQARSGGSERRQVWGGNRGGRKKSKAGGSKGRQGKAKEMQGHA